mmetsp:Transcript_14429/g.35287  ORF Transcript_14429/g.35287 Transcript_14429/m.35287 type:complete len:238 (-) Transcript_14429:20-733(-)
MPISGVVTYVLISVSELISMFDLGANTTMTMIAPVTATMPTKLIHRSSSLRMAVVMKQFTTTPMAPMGVTIAAGAKPYATRLPSSPAIISTTPIHHHFCFRKWTTASPMSSRAVFWLCANFIMFMPTLISTSPRRLKITPAHMAELTSLSVGKHAGSEAPCGSTTQMHPVWLLQPWASFQSKHLAGHVVPICSTAPASQASPTLRDRQPVRCGPSRASHLRVSFPPVIGVLWQGSLG